MDYGYQVWGFMVSVRVRVFRVGTQLHIYIVYIPCS